jgi:alpha-glucosidase
MPAIVTINYVRKSLFIIFMLTGAASYAQLPAIVTTSPDKRIKVQVRVDAKGEATYTIHFRDTLLLQPSWLGIVREDADFATGLQVISSDAYKTVTDQYELWNGKRRNNTYTANQRTISCKNASGQLMDIIFQVSNEGVAFRYYFPGKSKDIKKIKLERTTFRFRPETKGWLQPMSVAKTGWSQVNPCYEEFYEKNIPVGTPSPLKAGWVFPALFQSANKWLLITEAGMDGRYCGSKLDNTTLAGEYQVTFPDPREIFPGGANTPESMLPWYSPWRIITIGSLNTIVESTMGTDLALPADKKINYAFAKPGKASWSWPILKDDSIVYDVQKRFIDYAADMNWQYCLIDVNWDTKIGYDKIQELVTYARQKNVGIILWYNSAGSWNTVNYHPKDLLLTHEGREKEFGRLEKMGVAGVKIDFFGGDGQSMIQYYIDILKDAAAHRLAVNFHGATLPRGWQRTYPNLVSAEAIKGFEYVTFDQRNADEEPMHCAMLPFTRNAFDPMDFTPLSLYKIPRIQRKTTAAFELALSVLFLSGIQHFAETPEGMSHMPGYVKDFLRQLPVAWDDVKFMEGFPGNYVVMARKQGNKWYVAGINGTAQEKVIAVDPALFNGKKATWLAHSTSDQYINQTIFSVVPGKKERITMGAYDGFVLVIE